MKTLRLVIPFVVPYWRRMSLALLAAVGSSLTDVLRPWPLKLIVDNVIGGPRHHPLSVPSLLMPLAHDRTRMLAAAVALILLIAMMNGLFSFGQALWTSQAGQRIVFALRTALYGHIQRLSLGFHEAHRTGDLLSRVTNDIEAMQDMVTIGLLSLVSNGLTLAGMIVIMTVLDWQFAALALSVTPLLFFIIYFYTRRIKQAFRLARRKEGEVTAVALETFSSVRVVQAFSREDHEDKRFQRQNEDSLSASLRTTALQAQFTPLVNIVVAIGTCLIAFVGAEQVVHGKMSVGDLLVFLSYLTLMYGPMRQLSKLSAVISRATASAERVAEIMTTSPDMRDSPGAVPVTKVRGRVTFEHVSFAYSGGTPVLRDVDLDIKPGHTVALVGATGAGKSTLVSLVQRFHDPLEGRILLDGVDLRQLTLASLRASISIVPQESVLFCTTIAENIAYGRSEATAEEIVAAARDANAHDFIMRLPHAYDTVVGERGEALSGGQRQRIAIARAMVRDAPILILDEPTASLDAEAEELTLEAVERLRQGRSTIIIAHRLSTVRRANVIVVLEDGRIIEQGTHSQLLAWDSYYRRLLRLQWGTVDPVDGLIHLESGRPFTNPTSRATAGA